MSIVRFAPWWELDRSAAANVWVPAADVWETPTAYRIDLDVPAVSAEDVEVSVEGRILTVGGERKRADRDEDAREHRTERRHGRFSRRFRLPVNAEATAIAARVENGVLTLTIPKQPEHQPHRVEVVAA